MNNVFTFGCRLNTVESEVIRRHLAAAGAERTAVFNTCAVTKEAERQAKQAIRRYRRENPDAHIVVTGCAAQIRPQDYAAIPGVDRVLGNDAKLNAETWRADKFFPDTEKILVNDIMAVRETAGHLVTGIEGRTRAFLQVQNGCNHRCTFCIIPYGRGNSRSVPVGEVVRSARALVASGYRELVLTGVDLTAYGADLPGKPSLGELVRRLLDLVPDLPRLRLSSIDVAEIDDALLYLLRHDKRLMPHVHLSLQSGDDMILKRMKRRHTRAQVVEFCGDLRTRRPDITFGADIIAGFPTETDAMFENTLRLVAEAGLTWLHVFPFSAREGTPAANIPAAKHIPGPVKKERASLLRAAGEKQRAAFLASRLGKTESVIVEKPGLGRSEHFALVKISTHHAPGEIVSVKITGTDGEYLMASE